MIAALRRLFRPRRPKPIGIEHHAERLAKTLADLLGTNPFGDEDNYRQAKTDAKRALTSYRLYMTGKPK